MMHMFRHRYDLGHNHSAVFQITIENYGDGIGIRSYLLYTVQSGAHEGDEISPCFIGTIDNMPTADHLCVKTPEKIAQVLECYNKALEHYRARATLVGVGIDIGVAMVCRLLSDMRFLEMR